jgi:hypothetical protein
MRKAVLLFLSIALPALAVSGLAAPGLCSFENPCNSIYSTVPHGAIKNTDSMNWVRKNPIQLINPVTRVETRPHNSFSLVPEPTSLTLFGTGLLALAYLLRRKILP